MPKRLIDYIPDHDILLDLEPEELAGAILSILNSVDALNRGQMHPHNFLSSITGYPDDKRKEIEESVMEAWMWLRREGLIAPQPRNAEGWIYVTDRGKKLLNPEDIKSYQNSNILPKKALHPIISQKVWATFLRGDYDTAVFQAFKEVEVGVRNATKLPPEDIGVDLMRKAFRVKSGLLTDKSKPKAEQEALAHLFAGAIGSYKNHNSHRKVEIEAEEAMEMIVLASHLLNIVDQRIILNKL